MRLLHSSRLTDYREPFGALPAGSTVRLAIRLWPENTEVRRIYLSYAYGLYTFQTSRNRLQIQTGNTECDSFSYQVSLRLPMEPGLFFYWFEIETSGGLLYYTLDRETSDGRGLVGNNRPRYLPGEPHAPAAWQITLYDPGFQTPDWLAGAVIYQIFPDRFRRDKDFTPARFQNMQRPERIYHEDWSEEVDIAGRPETGYIACDFFGGSLNGIREKLDYIRDLGVTVIYLNPVFQARSNHRYDTGDYEQIDPLLGDENDFVELCREAAERGIHILLDGVFSHTGADSRYFNKYGRYPETGAYQEALGQGDSPYGSWYVFHPKGGQLYYDSWWGFQELPSVNEQDLLYRAYIAGTNGIARRWLRLGAAGWRLDVSDELPDSFLRDLRLAIRQEKPDAVLLGEVWEDASNKISYGSYRDFLFGRTHDHVMGYPFQQALVGWLAGTLPAERLQIMLETLREHYPPACFASNFNLISSHDIPRAITVLAGAPDPGNREAQACIFLDLEARRRGEALLRLAVLFQMVYPGCPVIYYGDETGMEGYRDPFNRRTFPWNQENRALQEWFGQLGRWRRDWPVLRTGDCRFILAAGDCLALERSRAGQDMASPNTVFLAINRKNEPQTLELTGRRILLPPYGCLLEADGERMLS
ncbi:MAG: glycoside hydrolase family 13 protein [Clostridiaceae bacterium]|nr:glycoside hydrolase family 13 protein [Clostridiaceae bacterium]